MTSYATTFLGAISVDVTPTGGGGSPPAAVHFDGSTALYNNAIANGAQSPKGTFFCWYKISPDDPAFVDSFVLLNTMPQPTPPAAYPNGFNGDSNLQFYVCNADFNGSSLGTSPCVFQAADPDDRQTAYGDTATATDTWQCIAYSWDLTNPSGSRSLQMLQNEAPQTPVVLNDDGDGAVAIDFTAALMIGAAAFRDDGAGNLILNPSGSFPESETFIGDIAAIYLDINNSVDLSDPAIIAKIISGGAPVDQGATGSVLTGSQPLIYLSGGASDFPTNKGNGGNLSVYGALTDAATAP